MKENNGSFVAFTLGMLTAFGPFMTDFYLPVLPGMTEWFETTPSAMELSLTMGMLGLALGQLFIGPQTDKYGRKGILLASMSLFCIASFCCILAPNIIVFNLMRFVQGVGAAGGVVIARSMAVDMYSGQMLMNFMALLLAINGIGPIAAPVVGGIVGSFFNWQGVFAMLTLLGILILACSFFLRETLPVGKRRTSDFVQTYGGLSRVMGHPRFALSIAVLSSCFISFFAYISSSTFILQNVYGMSSMKFGLCFGFNGTMLAVASYFSKKRKDLARGARNAIVLYLAGAACVALSLWLLLPLPVLLASYIILLLGFGLGMPVLSSLALDGEHENAGSASAWVGAVSFLAGSLVSPVVMLGRPTVSTGLVILLFSALSCLLTQRLYKKYLSQA